MAKPKAIKKNLSKEQTVAEPQVQLITFEQAILRMLSTMQKDLSEIKAALFEE